MTDIEATLFSTWLKGQSLEDMDNFTNDDFSEAELFALIKEHKGDAVAIHKANAKYTYSALSKLVGAETSEIIYRAVLGEALRIKFIKSARMIRDGAGVDEIKEKMDGLYSAICRTDRLTPAHNLYENYRNEIDARKDTRVLKYGLPTLDEYSGGINRKELTAVAARPGTGKSAFTLQIAIRAAFQGYQVLYFPLEMSVQSTLERVLQQSDIETTHDLQNGREKNPKDAEIFLKALEEEKAFWVYEGISDIDDIESLIVKHKPYLVVIDQLTQMRCRAERFQSTLQQFSHMTSNLKAMALKHNVAIILVCQVNRSGEDSPPSMSNLKSSGSIEEDSDNVILLHHDKGYDGNIQYGEKEVPILLDLAKHRNGRIGSYYVAFDKDRLRFMEKETR